MEGMTTKMELCVCTKNLFGVKNRNNDIIVYRILLIIRYHI